jgi:hypothetical protein
MNDLERIICKVKKLAEYINNLGELENGYDSGFMCDRQGGNVPHPKVIIRDVVVRSSRPIGIEYRFRLHEGMWQVGFFNDLGYWTTYDEYDDMGIARAMAIKLSKTQP